MFVFNRNIKNPIIPNIWPHGYVLKVTNALDSKKVGIFDAQTQLMLFLSQQNIQCPRPVMNIYGKYHSLEKIGSAQNNVRLLEFQPGKVFQDVLKTNNLYYQAGEYVAKVDTALKDFKHDAFDSHVTLWHMQSLPNLKEFLYVITDVERKDVVEQVIVAFETQVLQNSDKFARGVIHGDFNTHNILVNKTDRLNEFKVSGIIDFGDVSYSHYLFELAIAMAYMILQSEDIETGGLVIAGYSMIRNIPQEELDVLKVIFIFQFYLQWIVLIYNHFQVCVAARLCQSLVLGAYTHTQDPENDYVLSTQNAGWKLLFEMWAQPPNVLEELWASTADNYLKQSYK